MALIFHLAKKSRWFFCRWKLSSPFPPTTYVRQVCLCNAGSKHWFLLLALLFALPRQSEGSKRHGEGRRNSTWKQGNQTCENGWDLPSGNGGNRWWESLETGCRERKQAGEQGQEREKDPANSLASSGGIAGRWAGERHERVWRHFRDSCTGARV